jgi:hypothetical protein
MSEYNATTEATTPPPPSPRQVALGLFILLQLAFLIASNLLGYVKWAATEAEIPEETRRFINRAAPGFANERGHAWEWTDEISTAMRRWTQFTYQDQAWSLFAPTVSKATGFPAVVLIWEEASPDQPLLPGTMVAWNEENGIHLCAPWNPPAGSEPSLATARQLSVLAASSPWEALHLHMVATTQENQPLSRMDIFLSDNEPADMNSYFRVGNCRVRKYEGALYVDLKRRANETPDDLANRATRRVRKLVSDYHSHAQALAYMKWRLHAWQNAHPGPPAPKQVILFERFYRIHGPDEERGWDRPILFPIARWQIDGPYAKAAYVLEYFDFQNQRFEPVK